MTRVEVINLVKVYDKFVAVNDISFTVNSGEFFGLLGPSGCGKTTTLYCISGIETPTKGRILFDGIDVTNVPTQQRNIGMVFQSYAIFYNMTVYDNLAYPLRIRKMPKNEVHRKVGEIAELLGLKDILIVKGSRLTPAQMQLVSLGRAIIYDPSILLLDEPLSNLDPAFRMETLRHIRRIQRLLKITAIFVTHDQLEALSACDRIAVMQTGRIIQIGRPDEVYYNPANTFVAEFVGTPPMNLIEAAVENRGGENVLTAKELVRPIIYSGAAPLAQEENVFLGFKPEEAVICSRGDEPKDGLVINGRIRAVERTAIENIYIVEVGEKTVKFVTKSEIPLGGKVLIHVPTSNLYIYSKKTGTLLCSPQRQLNLSSANQS
ncbi:MAG: ABC transporter ATP-binding protein [Nitrososphaerota archaeon]